MEHNPPSTPNSTATAGDLRPLGKEGRERCLRLLLARLEELRVRGYYTIVEPRRRSAE